jgi:hypothetical protein
VDSVSCIINAYIYRSIFRCCLKRSELRALCLAEFSCFWSRGLRALSLADFSCFWSRGLRALCLADFNCFWSRGLRALCLADFSCFWSRGLHRWQRERSVNTMNNLRCYWTVISPFRVPAYGIVFPTISLSEWNTNLICQEFTLLNLLLAQ